MKRFEELVACVESKFPNHDWVQDFYASQELLEAQSQIDIYNCALSQLDEKSWKVLREKAIANFKKQMKNRGQQQVFDLLNEAFAYEFLIKQGYQHVRLLPRDPKGLKTPDIEYRTEKDKAGCEVKTINVSAVELERQSSCESYDANEHLELNSCFFNKLSEKMENAISQIKTISVYSGIVYLVIHFDDFTMRNYKKYKQQLSEYLNENFKTTEVYIRVGVIGNHCIHHVVQKP